MSCPSFHRPFHAYVVSWLHSQHTSSKAILYILQPLGLRLLPCPCARSVQECGGYHCIEHLNFCPPPYPTLPPQPLGQHVVGPSCLCYPRVNLLLHVIVGCDDTAQIGKGRDILKSIMRMTLHWRLTPTPACRRLYSSLQRWLSVFFLSWMPARKGCGLVIF